MPTPIDRARERCKAFESLSLTRYMDGSGWSIGYGRWHATATGPTGCPETCTEAEAEAWFAEDWKAARFDAYQLCKANGTPALNGVRYGVIVQMCFEIGQPGVAKFDLMWKAMKSANWWAAADEMMWRDAHAEVPRPSPWHTEAPERCRFLAACMRIGADGPAVE